MALPYDPMLPLPPADPYQFNLNTQVAYALRALGARIATLEATPAGSLSATEIEHDFGTTPVYDASFTITDAAITSSSKKVVIVPSGKAATGRTADDWQWDGATIVADPGTGSATAYVTFHPGPIVGPRTFQYMVA